MGAAPLTMPGIEELLSTLNTSRHLRLQAGCILPLAALVFLGFSTPAPGAGVTVITHGFNGNVTDWVIPMGDKIPQYHSFPGSNSTSYEISITQNGSAYAISETFLDGVSPLTSDSGEVVIALDWSSLSGLFGPSTSIIATNAALALLSTTLIPELGGRPLASMPLHLVGHSRGASVMAELARILGAQGLWVDHVTTLDPYPLGLNGDPPMVNYVNVLFADNYWQNIDAPSGQPLSGAYNRHLTYLTGGYPAGSSHSDTHLWYHGTVDLKTPAEDNLAMITSTERATWWTAIEAAGTNAGFLYSLIGGGNRLNSLEPAGAGNGRISDGINKIWDFGAGLAANRTGLPQNNGVWPNLIRLNLTGTTNFSVGEPIPLAFYHQYGTSTAAVATIRFYLDADENPYNGNEIQVLQGTVSGTGPSQVFYSTLNLSPDPATTLPGTYAVFARIGDAPRTRYLYAPQKVVLGPSRQAPVLQAARVQTNQFLFTISGWPGQKVIVQASTNLAQWVSIRTNTLAGTSLTFADLAGANYPQRYYRALLVE
jgi:hypothetical protein